MASSYTLFETPIGHCAVVWRGPAVLSVFLPAGDREATSARVVREHPGAAPADPPPGIRRAVAAMSALLEGRRADLSAIELDMSAVPAFHRRVYEEARRVPAGTTVSYGELAARIGAPKAARAVGQALGRNPFPIVIPCHRVVAAGGRIGGFSAEGGTITKQQMLAIEGALAAPSRSPSGPWPSGPGPAPGGRPPESPRPVIATGRARRAGGPALAPAAARRALRHLRAADPELARLIDAVGRYAMELQAAPSSFAALSEAIVYQQLSPKAAATIHRRFSELFGEDGMPDPEQLLELADAQLRGAGISGAKARALRDLAERTLSGEVPSVEEAALMSDDELVGRLTAVRGIGRWTAEMFL
ncbi:MAG TPA: methylated-DNA--[protein]-cysteine S-methyltransferase, partial [Acidimicrobiales bacterium]|nr:methylated-DNA--[protein]-cysteine S-methyltransferase [Acidimicrobiales bacterium]